MVSGASKVLLPQPIDLFAEGIFLGGKFLYKIAADIFFFIAKNGKRGVNGNRFAVADSCLAGAETQRADHGQGNRKLPGTDRRQGIQYRQSVQGMGHSSRLNLKEAP